jgi:hypothetical protein
MSRNKSTQAAAEATTEPQDNPTTPTDAGTEPAAGEQQAVDAGKSKWISRFGSFGDYQAGVRMIEDRQNKRMTIQFQDKPSDAVRAVLKSKEHGFRYDPNDKLWYKPIDQAKHIQSRQEADELVFKVANMIRTEKGLEPKDYGVSM